jgi:hypothetical protein
MRIAQKSTRKNAGNEGIVQTYHSKLRPQQQELDALQPKRERLTMVEGLIIQAEAEAAKLALALANSPNGVVGGILKQQIDDVNTRHAALCAERDALIAEIEAGALSDEQIAAMLATFSEDVIVGLQNAIFQDKRRAGGFAGEGVYRGGASTGHLSGTCA